jgi:hypothetical protein
MNEVETLRQVVTLQGEMIKELQKDVKALKGEVEPETFWDNGEIVKSLNQSTLINYSDSVVFERKKQRYYDVEKLKNSYPNINTNRGRPAQNEEEFQEDIEALINAKETV